MPSGKHIPPLPIRPRSDTPSTAGIYGEPESPRSGIPDLLTLLVAEYRESIRRSNEQRAEQGQKLLDPEAALRSAKPLLDFCRAYLSSYRPVQTFPVDANYGLLLANGVRCVVSPGIADMAGTMQDSGAVQVSRGESNPGQEGVIPVRGLDL